MNADGYIQVLSDALRARDVELEPGLTDAELDRVQQLLGAWFPPDLRLLLSATLPVSKGFPNWRRANEEELRWLCDGPMEGILFDIENNAFWADEWGPQPSPLDTAVKVARARLAAVPRLVPIYGHRYLPCDPPTEGNPVFSIVQTDIIYAGNDLVDYFSNEFNAPRAPWARSRPRPIMFWSHLTSG